MESLVPLTWRASFGNGENKSVLCVKSIPHDLSNGKKHETVAQGHHYFLTVIFNFFNHTFSTIKHGGD